MQEAGVVRYTGVDSEGYVEMTRMMVMQLAMMLEVMSVHCNPGACQHQSWH